MNKKVVIMSDKDSKTITEWLKILKEKDGIKLASKDLLHFLTYFKFINVCKNDEYINVGYKPNNKLYKKRILQFDVCEMYKNKRLDRKGYTIKVTKKGENYLIPFVWCCYNLRNTATSVKKQK